MRLSVGELAVAVVVLSAALISGCTSGQRVASDAVRAANSAAPPTATSPIADSGVTGTALPHGTMRILPPYCGVRELVATLPVPYDDSTGGCPRSLPTGANLGVLNGVHLIRLARLNVPEEGWTAWPVGSFSGFELTGPRGGGVAVFAYPALAGTRGDSLSSKQMLEALKARHDVTVVDSGPSNMGGWVGTWMDLTPDRDAPLAGDCHLSSPCLHLLAPMLEPTESPAELRPDVVSRLFIEEENEAQVRAAVWVRDINGPDAATALTITSSLVLGGSFEPRSPAEKTD